MFLRERYKIQLCHEIDPTGVLEMMACENTRSIYVLKERLYQHPQRD